MYKNRIEALKELENGIRIIISVFDGGVSFIQKSDGDFYFTIDHFMFTYRCFSELIGEKEALELIAQKYPN